MSIKLYCNSQFSICHRVHLQQKQYDFREQYNAICFVSYRGIQKATQLRSHGWKSFSLVYLKMLICSICWPVCNNLMHLKVTSDVESGLHLLHHAGRSSRDNSDFTVNSSAGVPKTTSPIMPALHHHGSYPLGVVLEGTPVPTLCIFLASLLSVIIHRVFISPETATCLMSKDYCVIGWKFSVVVVDDDCDLAVGP